MRAPTEKILGFLGRLPESVKFAAEVEMSKQMLDSDFLKAFKDGCYRVFVDMDGVLTDWEKQFIAFGGKKGGPDSPVDMSLTNSYEFWAGMPWKKKGRELWDILSPLYPSILSTPGSSSFSYEGKQAWVRDNLGTQTPLVLTGTKANYASPIAILIDDSAPNIEKWNKRGGIGILYKGSPTKVLSFLRKKVVKV